MTKVIPGIIPFPLLDDHLPIPTCPFSLTSSHSSGFDDQNSSSTPVAIRGTTEDSHMEAASFKKTVMELSHLLSDQAPGLHTSITHLPNSTGFSLLDTNSTYGKETPSDFQGHQLVAAGGCIPPPGRFLADRDHKKYWCEHCEIGFSQKQGFTRHNKDKHSQRNLCPYCRNFEWSPGRRYKLKVHLKENHPNMALPWS